MTVIGVTGTNGKTTTCSLLHHILHSLGYKTVYIGTTGVMIGDKVLSGVRKMTSYDPLALQRLLSIAYKEGCTHAILEVSSHGLHQKRFANIPFHVGVLTNITAEHLDYHGTIDRYAKEKQKLFRHVQRTQGKYNIAVLPIDDRRGKIWAERLSFKQTITYGNQGNAVVAARNIQVGSYNTKLELFYLGKAHPITFPLVGEFNVKNMLAAISVVIGFGHNIEEIIPVLESFAGVAGRQEHKVYNKVHRYIDYAHTPHGLQVMLEYLQQLPGKGRIITVFGAPGQRDKEKRPVMGKIVSNLSDVVIVTDDDPAKENRWNILRDVAGGVDRIMGEDFRVIPGRAHAITHAASIAQAGDIVLLAGIGHQDVLDTNFGYIPWSEKGTIEKAYEGLGK